MNKVKWVIFFYINIVNMDCNFSSPYVQRELLKV